MLDWKCLASPAALPKSHQRTVLAANRTGWDGSSLKATEQSIDTSTAAGKCFLDMLGVFAEFETNLRRERQRSRF